MHKVHNVFNPKETRPRKVSQIPLHDKKYMSDMAACQGGPRSGAQPRIEKRKGIAFSKFRPEFFRAICLQGFAKSGHKAAKEGNREYLNPLKSTGYEGTGWSGLFAGVWRFERFILPF